MSTTNGLDTMASSILSAIETANPGVTTPVATTPAIPAIPVTPATPVIPATEVPVEPVVATPVTPVTPVAEPELDVEPETPDALLKGIIDPNSPRGAQIWAGYQFAKKLGMSPEEGGIGHEPTLEDIREYHQDHIILGQILGDFTESPSHFIHGLAGYDPQALANFVEAMPTILAKSENPLLTKAYESVVNKATDGIINNMVAEARKYPTEGTGSEMRKWLVSTARSLKHWASNGEESLDLSGLDVKVDPYAESRRQLEIEQRKINAQRENEDKTRWSTVQNSIFEETNIALDKLLALPADVKPVVDKLPMVKEAMAQKVRDTVITSRIAKQELDSVLRNANIQMKQGKLNVQQAKMVYAQTFAKYARPVVARMIGEVTKSVRSMNKAPEPIPVSSTPATRVPTTPGSAPPPARGKNEAFEDFAARHILSGLQ